MNHSKTITLAGNLKRLFNYVSKRRRWQLTCLILLMFSGLVAEMATIGAVVPFLAILANPSVVKNYPLLQSLFETAHMPFANPLLYAAVLFSLLAYIAAFIRIVLAWVTYRLSFSLGADIGGEVYKRILYQPYHWHVSRNSSEILAGIQKVNVVTNSIIMQLMQGTVAFVMVLAIVTMLMAIDSSTALIAASSFAVLYGLTTLFSRQRLRNNSKLIAHNETLRIKAVQEGLGGIRDLILDGTQTFYHRRFTAFDYSMRRAQASNAFIGASPRYFIEANGIVLIIGLACLLSTKHSGLSAAIPMLGALAIGAQKLLPQMQLVYSAWSSISGNLSQLEDVLQLLERPILLEQFAQQIPEMRLDSAGNSTSSDFIKQQPSNDNVGIFEGQLISSTPPMVALVNVSFRYKPDSPVILKNINLDISKGARVGIVGKTGCGKSTLVDLIMGLLEPTSGDIKIDGQKLTVKNRRAWQTRIAHVPQFIYLSDTSLAENIAFGIPTAEIDFARVRQAAIKAQLADFIDSLPEQFLTSVGERGVRLSGGQRQRIGIARALYKKANLLVLDEPTSALDEATEESVISTIQSIGLELSVLIISHRLSTLRQCDYIIELGNTAIAHIGDYATVFDAGEG